ncbi:MAG TPA: hypothetical protein VI603_05700, partial [Saprospiraceae bacterium]|nr:hypothetical protein [Saprospiraceae bacterium]
GICMQDVTPGWIMRGDIGQDFTECLWVEPFVKLASSLMDFIFGGRYATGGVAVFGTQGIFGYQGLPFGQAGVRKIVLFTIPGVVFSIREGGT